MNTILHIVQKSLTRRGRFVWLISIMMLINFSGSGTPLETADGSRDNPYPIDLTNPTAIANVTTMDEVSLGSDPYKRITLLAGGTADDARVYYKLSGAANIADKVILWNYLKKADNTESTATHITLLVDGDAVSLYGMHLGGDVSLEAANSGKGKLTVSGSSTYFENTINGNGYALSFMEGYHFQVGTGLQVEVTSLLPRSDNKFQPFPDNVKGTFTINGALMGGTSFSTGAAPTNSIANTNITIDRNATANAILQIDVPNGVQSESLILKKKEGDTFTDYLTLPTKIAANPTRSVSIYSICVPAGTYQCWDGEKVLEQFDNSKGGSIKTAFEAKANAVTAYGLLCLPFDLSTITEATTFETWATNQSRAIYWGAATTASGVTNTRTVFSRLTQSGEKVEYPVTFGSSRSTRYLLCSSNINIEVSGDVPALTFGGDIVKFIQGNDAAKPLEKLTITLTNADKTKRALLVNGYSSLYGSLIVNGSVELQGELDLYGSLKIDTPKGTSNVTSKSTEKIRLCYVDDEDRYVSLSDNRDANGNVIPSTITVSPGGNIKGLTFSYITFEITSYFNKVKVQPGLTFAIVSSDPQYQIIASKKKADNSIEEEPLLPNDDGTYSYQMTEKDATLKSLSIYGDRLPPCLINGIPTPITLTCDKNGIWKYTYTSTSSEGQTYSDLFNGTLALNRNIGKDAGTQPIDVIVEGDMERTLTLDAVALRPTSGEYAIKVSQGKLKISPDYNASTIIPPVKDDAYQPALLVADGASCQVMYANSGNILFYGEAKAEKTDAIKGLVQLQWTNPIDKDVQITEKGETKPAATFPALPDASPKPSILAWNPNTYSTNWKTEYIVKKDGKQQVGKNSGGTKVTSYAYAEYTGVLTAFTGLRDISADEMVGAANVGASGTDVTITDKEYFVKTPIGLAWIAAVTNKKLTTGDAENPSANGFAECTVRIGKLNWGETIDLSKLEFDWVPIGNSDETPFKGTLNGAVNDYSYKITNLPGSLIGKTAGAKILNMCVHLTGEEGGITGSSWGGLVATATNQTTIDNCYVSTTSAISPEQAPIVLSGSGLATVGGMVGTLDKTSTLKNCYSTLCLSVPTGNVTLGGIAGKSEGTLSNCFCLGSLSAPEGTVGGIVGDGSVEYGLALSPSITGATVYRVASTTGKNNYASSKTLLNDAVVTSDGATVYMHDFKTNLVGAWGDRQYDSQTDKLTNYPWTFDEGNNFTPLLGIKADDGTYASRSGNDQPYQFSDYLIYELVTINATVTYSEDLHKDRDVVIKPNGVLNCPSGASVHYVTIEPGGQITGGKGSYLYPSKFIIPREIGNQWTTFYSPTSGALKASALSFALYRNTGYTDAKDASQVWTKDDVEAGSGITIKKSSPYLLSAESPQTVTFTASSTWATLDNALGADGPDTNTGIFLFKGNPRLHNVEMKNIYALSADGSCFDLQATYTLKPFECYIVANAQTRSLVRSLSLKDMPTGIDQPLAATFRLWSSGGQLCLSAERDTEVTIVSVAGQVVYHQRIPAGEQRITLPSGIYFVRGEGITYKVKL